MKSDEQLVQEAVDGSSDAFDELVYRYRDKLLRFLLTRCASHADAEDATQDSFINAYRYLDSFNSRWRFSTWLYRIAIRNAMKIATQSQNTDDEQADNDGPLQACIIDSERQNLWITARSELSEDACSAMWLHYVEDMPIKDVARALDKSLSWAKVTLHRSRQRLTEVMRPAENGTARSESYG